MYSYLEFKLRYLKKKLKLFSIGVKELFEPIVLRRKGDGVFAVFKDIFLKKNKKKKNDLWVTLDDFKVKTQIWEGQSAFNWKSIK